MYQRCDLCDHLSSDDQELRLHIYVEHVVPDHRSLAARTVVEGDPSLGARLLDVLLTGTIAVMLTASLSMALAIDVPLPALW